MNNKLNDNDYTKILQYYNLNIPKSKRLLKKEAENIITQKLCSCIKKVEPVYKVKSVGICTRSVINNKGLKRGKFSCTGKTKRTVALTKIKRNLSIGEKTRKNKKL
jgi:hypothetical protein